jgi:2-polyprenyl-6-methoxyphenol hydroxylase-like FAD-dependent oxidoreductase
VTDPITHPQRLDGTQLKAPWIPAGANAALRDAALHTRQLNRTAQRELPLPDAIGEYDAEMREYGLQAVDLAMKTLRQGLASTPTHALPS